MSARVGQQVTVGQSKEDQTNGRSSILMGQKEVEKGRVKSP